VNQFREVSVEIEDLGTRLSSTDGLIWSGDLDLHTLSDGARELKATATNTKNEKLTDSVRLRTGPLRKREFANVDYENAIGEWCDRGLLGTQLGPNKNGKKW
jgi:Icc protein